MGLSSVDVDDGSKIEVNVNMKSTATLTIGDLAARFGLATHVLRHWESMGLLEPAKRVSGHRRYTADHIARMAMIVRYKDGGMSLEQVRDLLNARDRKARLALLRRHYDALETKIQEIEKSKAMIRHAMTCRSEDYTKCPAFRQLVDEMAGP
jgi:MerR family transcriptional regulator, copper efflux regulator